SARRRGRGGGRPLPRPDSPPRGVARRLRRRPQPATGGAGGPGDPLLARASRPDGRRSRARGRVRGGLLRLMQLAARRPALSIVVPLYDEEGNVGPLHEELTEVARRIGRSYEVL